MRQVTAGLVLALVTACGGKGGPAPVAPEPPAAPEPPEPAAVAPSGSPGAKAPASRWLAQDLGEVHLFALGGIGYGGVTSRGEELTLALSREPDAIEVFTRLGRQSGPASRLYAYWALRTLAPDRAVALAKRLRQIGGRVERMTGCLRYEVTVAETLAELDRPGAAQAMPRP